MPPATLVAVTGCSKSGTSADRPPGQHCDLDPGRDTTVKQYRPVANNGKTGIGPYGIGTWLFTQTMTGGVLGSGTATGTTWACTEGGSVANVGAHLCGDCTFGPNFVRREHLHANSYGRDGDAWW